jgi:sec-independent protein translocase protein TatB
MPGIGFMEMILLAVVAIVVIGPKDLPLMMRKFGKFTGQMRALAFEFRQGIDELGRQAELEELRKEVEQLKSQTGLEDLQKDLAEDQANLQKDVDSALAEGGSNSIGDAPQPRAIVASDEDLTDAEREAYRISQEAGPEAIDHTQTAENPMGDDFRLEGHPPEPRAKQDEVA